MSKSGIRSRRPERPRRRKISKLLVANRSEIAIRVLRAASELDIRTVAVFSEADKLSLHRVKADESYLVGAGRSPLEAYLSIDEIVRVAKQSGADAVHPGYGFLSENPDLAEACEKAGLSFIGPSAELLRTFGNKVTARQLAAAAGVPVIPATGLLQDDATAAQAATAIGYPLMIKAAWGGGGRGIRPILSEDELTTTLSVARSEAKAAFGRDDVYLERFISRAKHIEVQILGDQYGNIVHLYERDCSIQRRNQKIIERAPAPSLRPQTRKALCGAAVGIAHAASYAGAGTVEFLVDEETGEFYFIEVNPRIQVEHTVTEMVTGIDIVKAQIRIAEGGQIGRVAETGVPQQQHVRLNGHALQCRITTEDPQNGFMPDYGRISAYRGAGGFGVRVDSGTAYAGAIVTPYYDPLLEKVITWAPSPDEAASRMHRTLREYRIRGLRTNLTFLQSIVDHEAFKTGNYTTRFIDQSSDLLGSLQPEDRATKLLAYIGEVTVNGKTGIARASSLAPPRGFLPPPSTPCGQGTRHLLKQLGPEKFATWMRRQRRPLVTDTTMRDAHQALLATRVRSYDILGAAAFYADRLPQLLSLECWGGATFDVAMRFLNEDPWQRLSELRARVPNIMLQMLLRGANAVGYTNYPDNFVKFFVRQAAEAGIDVFRIFDCLNWVENMRPAIEAAREANGLVEGTVCYTGDILDPDRVKYSIGYYVDIARQLERAGCHILCIKDMAGLLKPAAARLLIKALRSEIGMPVHLHTHDTTGTAAATVIAAVESGVDAFDAAIDSMSGAGSQPCLGSLVQTLRHGRHDTGLDADAIVRLSSYWADVRALYASFESNERWGTSEVYLHEMPGGQVTNLKEQAKSLGLSDRWTDIARAYRAANDLLGDIVKVTPTSKVVGDLALLMVSQGLTAEDLLDGRRDIAFPDSVAGMLRGELGQPIGGWPKQLQTRVLKGETVITTRPGAALGVGDIARCRSDAEQRCGRAIDDRELASYMMYPEVFTSFIQAISTYGPVSRLPTRTFFSGMTVGEDIEVEIETGKSLLIRLVAIGETDHDGRVDLFFELNGQPRLVRIFDRSSGDSANARRKAEPGRTDHIPAPFASSVSAVHVKSGQIVNDGDVLLTLEAMKMQTAVRARRAGTVESVLIELGDTVEAGDLLIEIAAAANEA
jgi:pyruvate carboxylase